MLCAIALHPTDGRKWFKKEQPMKRRGFPLPAPPSGPGTAAGAGIVDAARLCGAQHGGQPAGAGEQSGSTVGHLILLEFGDVVRRRCPLPFGDGLKDELLRDPSEIV